ncbi:hypothetical protein EV361DRAFT_791650 [Lentinula raphanica]|uniref:ER-bound oxygenase mpaB/mpaB'/Rubber oxygenase catalytic domain-containing protein n=1 Tax=Lentinula raphanica TaxID=153919 RepID=A0AA38PJJ9_9AGAR|nr:hypothetical protein F5878DRAFT_602719 [Lentinula raphanica]KAJ3975753.1 hypothetical protein EV361DRAFT_791650 [Lentinula raphanica]
MATKTKIISRSTDSLALENGTTFQVFGRTAIWDKHCVRRETALRWRTIGDPLCDAAIQELFPDRVYSGADLLQCLESSTGSSHRSEDSTTSSSVQRFWDAIHEHPPMNIRASREQVEVARSFFIDHSVQIMQALLYYSLAGGFASPRIVRTLDKVSYLIPPNITEQEASQNSKDRTFKRLLETFQFVLEVMRCVVPFPEQQGSGYLLPGGDGWKSIIRVRMLHGVARTRVRAHPHYQGSRDSPINQEDMNATLASFCIVPLWSLRQLGLKASRQEEEAFLAVWRHVGFYLGVDPASLDEHFSNTVIADQYLLSATIHLFLDDEELEDQTFMPPTLQLLEAVTDRFANVTLEYNCAMARLLLGPELSTYLGIPSTSWQMGIRLREWLFLQAYPVLFSRSYGRFLRPGWLEKRRYVYAVGMAMTIRRTLGMRRTKYRPVQGEVGQIVWEDESVPPDYATGRLLGRRWKQMLAEMVGVTVSLGIAITGLGCWWMGVL